MRQGNYVKEQIRLYMDAQGVSQAELARRLSVSPQSIHQVLGGQKSGIAPPLETILDALGLELVVQPKEHGDA